MEKGKTMSDYIKREDAIKAIEREAYRHDYLDHIIEIVDGVPSADVVPMERYKSMENTCVKLQKALADVAPVRHGKWEMNDDYTCSLCGYRMVIGDGAYRYCPNCGARMDGESDE